MIRIGSDEPFYPYTCPRNFFNSEMRDSELKKYPNQKSIIKNNNSWGKRRFINPTMYNLDYTSSERVQCVKRDPGSMWLRLV